MTTEMAPDAQFEELVERVLATTIFNEPFVTQLITEAHNARGRVAEAEAERDTARQIASNAIAEAKKLRAELAETDARARHGSAPLTLAQAAGHLHDWAGDLADGTRTDWPAGHPDIIHGIRAAADWLDARASYETEVREQQATDDYRSGCCGTCDAIHAALEAREQTAAEMPDVDGWTIYPFPVDE